MVHCSMLYLPYIKKNASKRLGMYFLKISLTREIRKQIKKEIETFPQLVKGTMNFVIKLQIDDVHNSTNLVIQ